MVTTLYDVAYFLSSSLLDALGTHLPNPLGAALMNGGLVWLLSAALFGAILLGASMINTIMLIWFERKM
ncbi:MAG: hypothetical protein L3K19_02070, partial [Thermoplasmata archaeon]|nr:hypothetical protein [Thermoplasmata archaeon]